MLPALEEQVTVKAAKEGHRLRAVAQLEAGCFALGQVCVSDMLCMLMPLFEQKALARVASSRATGDC